MPIRTLLLSEHPLCRESLQALLQSAPDLSVTAVALDAVAAAPRAEVVLFAGHAVDDRAEGLVGRLAALGRVLFIGDFGSSYDVARLRAAGVSGIVSWTQPSVDLFAAVRCVGAGSLYVAPALLPPDGVGVDVTRSARHPLACLSPREREVFAHVVGGRTNAVVARQLGISAKTADTHRAHMMRKLGLHSAVHLVRFAARHRLLDDAADLPAAREPA